MPKLMILQSTGSKIQLPNCCCFAAGHGLDARWSTAESSELENVLQTLLPYGSSSSQEAFHFANVADVEDAASPQDSGPHFESSNDAKTAAEKHAFVHSHAGLEDVF